jgi:hypothetical protein
MAINRYNYEMFLVDYLDGKLNPSMVAELMEFLELNPDIQNELEGLDEVVLVNESIRFPNKSDLKKKSFSKNGIDNETDYLLIASVEKVITNDEKFKLDEELNRNEERRTEYTLYQRTIIQPASEIVYPNKTRLKRVAIVPIRYSTLRKAVGIASSIGLIIGVYTLGEMVAHNHIKNIPNSNTVASTNHSIKTTPEKSIQINNPIVANASSEPQRKVVKAVKPLKSEATPKSESNRREEIIPAQITRIELNEIAIGKDSQYEQIAQFTETSPKRNLFSKEEQNNYSENSSAKPNVKEIGVFEIIQYGVQSFGKLIGRDIRLNANKDKNGKIEKINFESSLVAFSAPIRKKE